MSTSAAPRTASLPSKALVMFVVGAFALAACGSSSYDSKASPSTTLPNARTLLAKALREMSSQQTDQAQTDFEEVLRLDPQNKYAYYNLGYIAQIGGHDTDAETQYRHSLAIDPKFEPALYSLAILRANAGATEEAIGLYRQAIAVKAKDANAHFNLGLLLRHTGKTDEGNAEIALAVQLDPSLASKAAAQGVPGINQ